MGMRYIESKYDNSNAFACNHRFDGLGHTAEGLDFIDDFQGLVDDGFAGALAKSHLLLQACGDFGVGRK